MYEIIARLAESALLLGIGACVATAFVVLVAGLIDGGWLDRWFMGE